MGNEGFVYTVCKETCASVAAGPASVACSLVGSSASLISGRPVARRRRLISPVGDEKAPPQIAPSEQGAESLAIVWPVLCTRQTRTFLNRPLRDARPLPSDNVCATHTHHQPQPVQYACILPACPTMNRWLVPTGPALA